jgi:3-oxoacyl-[acyl-carrier-protein] synthase III
MGSDIYGMEVTSNPPMYIDVAAHYLPETILPNEYYTSLTGLTDEWIYARSGIRRRTRTGAGENTNTMAVEAVKAALDRLPYPVSDVDLIVGATYTPYDTVGTLAHAVQSAFEIPKARAISISSACSSFLNAVEIVEGYFATNKARKAVVVVSEHNSVYSDDRDEQAGHLWGDGAAAVFISKTGYGEGSLRIIDVSTAGLGHVGKSLDGVYLRPSEGGLKMPYGRDVFVHATKFMVSVVETLMARNHVALEDITYLIPHQANMRIIKHVAQTLGLGNGKVIINMEEAGNTGSASTAIALSQNWNRFAKGDLIAITVFGGGYSSGAMLLKK